ncbi:uncharacterized protein LOC113315343 [Papaver somniferum]|uniref:uncharacterized protein LOC113315343 n=1 Tax=Papaver somniferum TaxID=3469 RepID=UPI000E6FE671|nr:uncharacterized protein LOC113315343 [Papaver somniferum]
MWVSNMSEKVIHAVLKHGEHSVTFRVNTSTNVDELKHFAYFYLNVDVILKHTSRSNYGCSTSSGSSTANSCVTESPKLARVVDHDADKAKPLICDEWIYIFDKVIREFIGGAKVVRLFVDKYKMATGYKIVIFKNDKTRFTAKCEENDCGWRIHFRPMSGDLWCWFEVKEAVTTKLVKHLIADNIQGDPILKPIQIMSLFKKTYGSNIKYHHPRRRKEAVFEEQFGDDEKSYNDLTWYVKAIEQTNPDSFVNFEVDHSTRRLQRIFICFSACKHSFRYLRPMIYLDVTFLTGRFKGTLMAATCINGNNGFYPFAFALVSAENKDNWFWFLYNLKQVVDGRQIVFLSDRGEGLLQGIPKLTLKKLCMHAIGCGHVANYISVIPKEKWAIAFLSVCRYNAHSLTLSESFNNWILDFKKLPAFTLLDAIRLKVMKKNSERMIECIENFNTRLTLIYEALLKENFDIGLTWIVTESMEILYEVASPRSHSVDLLQKTCTCHRWQVNGFPCARTCATIQPTKEEICSFFEPYFTTEWYKRTYQEIILPIPNYYNPQAYDPSDRVIVPIHVPPPGRRRAHRIKNTCEKQKRPMMCTKCFTLGHHNRDTRPIP